MSEIFSAIKLKNKITIASAMAGFAVVLVTIIGIITACSLDTHNHKYNYKLVMDADGSFTLLGVCTVRNCESPYYTENHVGGVSLFSYEKPTCSVEGKRVYSYTKDGVTVNYTETVPTIPHDYEGESVNGTDGVFISGHCKFDDCRDPEIVLDDFDGFKLDSVVEATCSTPKIEIYKRTLDEGTITMEIQVDEYMPHTLNGAFVDEEKSYPLGTAGIKIPAGTKGACNSTVGGSYLCEKCNQNIAVKVVLPDHVFVYSIDNVVSPTLEKAGKATLHCENSVCTDTREEILPMVEVGVNTFDSVPATELYREKVTYRYESSEYGFTYEKVYEVGEVLVHHDTYGLVPDSNNTGTWNVVSKKCDQADCQAIEVVVAENVDAKLIKDTTSCCGPGELEWEYEYEGQIIKAYAYMPFPTEHKYSNHGNIKYPNFEQPGSIDLYCEKCNESITVELPKMVIGSNAEFVKESGDGGFVYKYVCETEHNYTVELSITVYLHAK